MLQAATVDKADAAPGAPSRIGRRFGSWPAIVFALLSLFFGSAIIAINPPLRGPDEISHFLRIYSYARGELLPVTEIDGRPVANGRPGSVGMRLLHAYMSERFPLS